MTHAPAPPQLALNIVRCYTLAALRGLSLRHWAQCAFIRFALRRLTARQLQYMVPPTVAVYQSWIPRRRAALAASASDDTNDTPWARIAARLTVDIEALPDGASSLLWLGDRHTATKFVLFFHGGGYIAPLTPGHLEWCARAYLRAGADHAAEDVAVAVLQYTLCPDAHYPAQLRQAADGLAHVLASGRVRAGDLVIGGDSAGGNLTAQLLGHLLRPHPAARAVVLEEPLAGAFLVSPWLSGRTAWPGFGRNGGIDMLTPATMAQATAYMMGTAVGSYGAEVKEGNEWAMAMDLEDVAGWFTGLDQVVREVYVTAGEQEVLLDQGIGFAEAVRRGNPAVTVRLEVMKDEAHDWILLEGDKGVDGDAMKRMRAWVQGVFWP